MVYKNNNWIIQDKKEQIDDMYDYNEILLENWYNEYKNKYPSIIESFNKYLHNKEDNDIINEVKKDILVMLYNKRGLVLKNKNKDDDFMIEYTFPEISENNETVST